MTKITGTYDNQQIDITGAATEETLQDLVEAVDTLTGKSKKGVNTGTILLRRGPTGDRLPLKFLNGEIVYDSDLEQVFVGNNSAFGGKSVFGDKILVESLNGNLTATDTFTIGRAGSSDKTVINADIDSKLNPSQDNTHDLGSEDARWGTIYANRLVVTEDLPGGGSGEGDTPRNEFENINVSNNITLGGKIKVGERVFLNKVTGDTIGLGINSLENSTGTNNVALGNNTLRSVLGGSYNTALGRNAGQDIETGNNNITIGSNAAISDKDASDEIVIGNTQSSRFTIPGLGIDYTRTGSFKTPAGTTGERDTTPGTGGIRFNTDQSSFEGYNGSDWVSLGSVSDNDRDTFIRTESAIGADEDTLDFVTGGKVSAILESTLFEVSPGTNVKVSSTEPASGIGTGALTVAGGASITGDLIVAGDIVNSGVSRDDSEAQTGTAASETLTRQIDLSNTVIYSAGSNVRVFNASRSQDEQSLSGLGIEVARVGFDVPGGSDTITSIQYRVAQFDFDKGTISQSLSAVGTTIKNSDLSNFNNEKNIQLTLSRLNTNTGIIIYRKAANQAEFSLVTVLGPRDLGNSTANLSWTDYFGYDAPDWTQKDFTNAYTADSGLVHFPLRPPENSQYGWLDTTVQSVNATGIELATEFYTTGEVTVYNDDTENVQSQIDASLAANSGFLKLGGRRYFIGQLTLPNNFSIIGQDGRTEIIKLPWYTTSVNSNEIIKVSSGDPKDIVLRSVIIDGNNMNQYLTDDVRESSASFNYAVTLFGKNISLTDTTIRNTIGGGVYMFDFGVTTRNATVSKNNIIAGGISLKYSYSPLLANESENAIITQNNFNDFPSAVEGNSLNRSIVTNNIIKNCGSGLDAFATISTVLNPNVLVGPAGEFLPNPDTLNSEFDSVNIQIEPGVTYNSPELVYTESGTPFDLDANQGSDTGLINELLKVNGVEVIGDDYSTDASGNKYITFRNDVDRENGALKWQISQTLVDNLLSRASFDQLYAADTNSRGLIYRIVHTEYVPQTSLTGECTANGNIYTVPVADVSALSVQSVIRLVDHNSTPSVATSDGTITSINNVTNTIDVDFGFTVTTVGNAGSVALKNNFVIVKGKIN